MGPVAITRRRRRWPLVLVVLLIVVGAVLYGVDVVSRDATQRGLASSVQKSTHARDVDVTIHSFPYLWYLGMDGTVGRIDFVGTGVPAGPVTLDRVELDATSVHVDRHQLLDHQHIEITAVGSATLTVTTRLSTLENALAVGFDVKLIQVAAGRLAVSAAGHTITTIDLAKVPVIPECPLDITHTGDTFRLSCTVSPVPATVIAALSKAHRQQSPGG